MRRLTLAGLLTCALLLACSPEPAPSAPGEPRPESREALVERLRAQDPGLELLGVHALPGGEALEHYRLGNGLEIFYQRATFSPSVVVQTWLRVGSRHDPEGLSGLAHALEHLMFRAVGGLEDGAFDATMERLGVETNAYTWYDYTLYDETVPRAAFEEVIALEASRLRELAIPEAVLEAERKVLLSERAWRIDGDAGGVMVEALYARLFREHPYALKPTGTPAGLKALRAQDALDFYARHYRPERVALVLIGDVERAAMLETVLGHHGALERGAGAPEEEAEARRRGPVGEVERLVIRMPIDAEMVLLGFRTPPASSRERVALEVLVQLLFSSPRGLITHALRDELDLASSVEGFHNAMRDASALEMMVVLRKGISEARAREVIARRIEALTSETLPVEAIEAAKARLELLYRRDLADPRMRGERIGQAWVMGLSPDEVLARIEAISELSPREIRRVAGLYLAPQRRTEIAVEPRGDGEEERP